MNSLYLLLHISLICAITLAALRIGVEALIAWICLLAVCMNLFILKQINLFGLSVTASDALAVGYLMGLNLVQEYFGKKQARKTVLISFVCSASFLLLTQLHLLYQPNTFDLTQAHYTALLLPMPRILFASLFSFFTIQLLDLYLFAKFRTLFDGRRLALRTTISLALAQTLDTLLFSFLGLYGHVEKIGHIILFSLLVKLCVIALASPFVNFSKKVALHEV